MPAFSEFSEKNEFAEFEKQLECELANLEERWGHMAAPCAEPRQPETFELSKVAAGHRIETDLEAEEA